MTGRVTLRTAARLAGRSLRTIQRWVHDGDLRVGPDGRVHEHDVLRTEKRMRDQQRTGRRPERNQPAMTHQFTDQKAGAVGPEREGSNP